MTMEQFDDLPRRIREALQAEGIAVKVNSEEKSRLHNHMSVIYPINGEQWDCTQKEIDFVAPQFILHCFSMWAKESLAGYTSVSVSDALALPEGIDCGVCIGDSATIPMRIVRVYNINADRFGYCADVIVTAFNT